jgi:hypothetical protein
MNVRAAMCAVASLLALPSYAGEAPARTLTLEDRVAAQRAIERVLAGRRLWPEVNPGAKRPPEVSDEAIRRKVEHDLRASSAITAAQLQAEMNRMARNTQDPAMLQELFAALGNDPFLIAETLARPLLASRLVRDGPALDLDVPKAAYELPAIADACVAGTWRQLPTVGPRASHVAVWTGSEMIVFGGTDASLAQFVDGARYEPETDTWSPMSAPTFGGRHLSAVWTGAEMVVWGGPDASGRYDPATDSWRDLGSPSRRPIAGPSSSMVWTGSEVIVWGGGTDFGGRYDPATDAWQDTNWGGAPYSRSGNLAVWTGDRMVIYGGTNPLIGDIKNGASYFPATNRWVAISNVGAPFPTVGLRAVWSGKEMLVWGPQGGRYDPATNTWRTFSASGAPAPSVGGPLVWTGEEMIVARGDASGRYDPGLNRWRPMNRLGPPVGEGTSVVWTGKDAIVWGADGSGRYDADDDVWLQVADTGAPSAREGHSAVWTGVEMIVWGGTPHDEGGVYAPVFDTWRRMSTTGSPPPRERHVAVWTGIEMIVWGGMGNGDGGRYDPSTDLWRPMSTQGAPLPSFGPLGAWTGRELIVSAATNATYDPAHDTWLPIAGGPLGLEQASGIWTGDELIVWGGIDGSNAGWRYSPSTGAWTETTHVGAPAGRHGHKAVWNGGDMVITGGVDPSLWSDDHHEYVGSLGIYSPARDTWSEIADVDWRQGHSAVWTGRDTIVWGGRFDVDVLGSGFGFSDAPLPLTDVNAPQARSDHSAIWTGRHMIVWGGRSADQTALGTGAMYCACPNGRPVYRDRDGDGYGDPITSLSACDDTTPSGYVRDASDCQDSMPAAFPGAPEVCNGIDDDCNGLTDDDALGLDIDGDLVADSCDNCLFDSNAAQTDIDGNGKGDACDLEDGLIYLVAADRDHIVWQQETGAAAWNVYEGDLAVLKSDGTYTQVPGSNPLAGRRCGLTAPPVDDLVQVPPGAAKFALVTAAGGGVEGTLGTNSAGVPRENKNPCP